MKTFAVKEKQPISTGNTSRHVHHPMAPVQWAQQAEIGQIIHSTSIQAKLAIGQPGDKYEREADRVADQVMRMPETKVQRQEGSEEEEEVVQTKPVADQITPLVQRQAEPEEEEEEEPVQTKLLGGQITPLVQRQVEPEEEEEEMAQTKPLAGEITPLVQRQPEMEEEEEPVQAK